MGDFIRFKENEYRFHDGWGSAWQDRAGRITITPERWMDDAISFWAQVCASVASDRPWFSSNPKPSTIHPIFTAPKQCICIAATPEDSWKPINSAYQPVHVLYHANHSSPFLQEAIKNVEQLLPCLSSLLYYLRHRCYAAYENYLWLLLQPQADLVPESLNEHHYLHQIARRSESQLSESHSVCSLVVCKSEKLFTTDILGMRDAELLWAVIMSQEER